MALLYAQANQVSETAISGYGHKQTLEVSVSNVGNSGSNYEEKSFQFAFCSSPTNCEIPIPDTHCAI
jgi:hypothetical protein